MANFRYEKVVNLNSKQNNASFNHEIIFVCSEICKNKIWQSACWHESKAVRAKVGLIGV